MKIKPVEEDPDFEDPDPFILMKIITLAPAMAWLVIFSSKDIENRSWIDINVLELIRTGEKFGIHAGKYMTGLDYKCAVSYARQADPRVKLPKPDDITRGAIIGTAKIHSYKCPSEGSPRPWRLPGLNAWILKERTPLTKPLPCRGYQRFWNYDLVA